jgi:tetratricopeptide (TPR) repeat protein
MIALHQHSYAEARVRFEEAMRLHQEVGDRWSVALHHNNLGNATRELGDLAAARANYAASLEAYLEYGDRWGLAFLLEDVALLAARTGDHTRAIELVEAADALRLEIGALRAPSLEEDLRAGLAASHRELGPAASERAGSRGHALTLEGAVGIGLAVCAMPGS